MEGLSGSNIHLPKQGLQPGEPDEPEFMVRETVQRDDVFRLTNRIGKEHDEDNISFKIPQKAVARLERLAPSLVIKEKFWSQMFGQAGHLVPVS